MTGGSFSFRPLEVQAGRDGDHDGPVRWITRPETLLLAPPHSPEPIPMRVRGVLVLQALAAAALTACSSASPTAPLALDEPIFEATDAMLRELTATHVLSGPQSPAVRRALAEV